MRMGVAGALEFRPRMSGTRSLQLSRTSNSSAPTPVIAQFLRKLLSGSTGFHHALPASMRNAAYPLALVQRSEMPSIVGRREYGRGRAITPRIRAGPGA